MNAPEIFLEWIDAVTPTPKVILPEGDNWKGLETHLVVTTGQSVATGILRAEARVLLNILQCTSQPPTTNNYLAQNFNSAEFKRL